MSASEQPASLRGTGRTEGADAAEADEAAGTAGTGAPGVRGALRLLGSELALVFGRRRNQVGLAVLAAVPVLIAVAVRVFGPASSGEGPEFLSAVTENGFFVALTALGVELGLFLPLAVATIAGDAVAGEANLGTLRYLLTVPVRRARLLGVKYAAIVVFALAATLVVAGTGLAVGLALFGGGPVTLLSGSQISLAAGLLRLAGTTAYLAAGFAALGAVGLFVSTLTEQPIAATVTTVLFCVGSFILDAIPQLGWLHPFLITHDWQRFGDLFRAPVVWDGIGGGLFLAASYAVVFWLAAWARFAGKDVTS